MVEHEDVGIDGSGRDGSFSGVSEWSELEALANDGNGVNSVGWDSVAAMAGRMGGEEEQRRDEMRQRLLEFFRQEVDGEYKGEDREELEEAFYHGGWGNDDEFVAEIFRLSGGEAEYLLDIGTPIEKILENDEYYDGLTQMTGFPVGVLGSIYEKMCIGQDGRVSDDEARRFKEDFADNVAAGYELNGLVGNVLKSCGVDYAGGTEGFGHGVNDDIVEASMRDLFVLKSVGVDILDFSKVPNLFYLRDDTAEVFGEKMLAAGLLGRNESSRLFHLALEYPYGNGKIIDVLIKNEIRPRDDDVDGSFWYDSSVEREDNVLRFFMEEGYKSANGDFDFENPIVQRAFINRMMTPAWDFHNIDFDSFESIIGDEEFQNASITKIAEATDRERSIPALMLMFVADKNVLDSMIKRGVFERYPQLGELKDFANIASGKYTERDRMRLFYYISDYEKDEYYDERGYPNDKFYDAMDGRLSGGFFCRECLTAQELQEYLFYRGYKRGISNADCVGEEGKINGDNIVAALTRFIKMDAVDWNGATESDQIIREAFSGGAKDLALSRLREVYGLYLQSSGDSFPVGLKFLADYMQTKGGAGPLTQIEAFLDFMGGLSFAGEEGKKLTAVIENRMDKGRWDNQERTNFYAISAEILRASPDLYAEFAELFANAELRKEEFEIFTREIYPLYRAKLALLRQYEDHSNGVGGGFTTIKYDSADVDELREQLHNTLLPFNLKELSLEKRRVGIKRVREKISSEISGLFQEKFSILPRAIPESFNKHDDKAVEDMTLYLGNLARPTQEKKDLIGFFLALQLDRDGAWDKLRSGAGVAIGSYIDLATGFSINRAIKKSRQNDPVNAENTRIFDEGRLGRFKTALQREVTDLRLSDIQTVDLRLQSLVGGVEELTDPDLYPEGIYRDRVEMLSRYPVNKIGAAVSKMQQRMMGRDIAYGENEEEIASEVERVLKDNGIEMNRDTVKTYFQDGIKGIQEPFRIIGAIRDSGAIDTVNELHDMLTPSDDVAKIFGRLGEEFRPQSGAVAVGEDLDFLENLVVKRENDLDEDEKATVMGYIDGIRQKLVKIDKSYEEAVSSFSKMVKMVDGLPAGVGDRVKEIDRMIHGGDGWAAITTTCTGDMLTIIENMRACLSCKTKGINNDTDLTFGEGYKFYLYSQSGSGSAGSMADEIVYFVPVGEGDDRRMGFVMDKVYGKKNRDILVGHVGVMVKKARDIKKQFPEVPISVVIPGSTFGSCGVSSRAEDLIQGFGNGEKVAVRELASTKVVVPESGYGDHYIEFGGGARVSGGREISGVEIIIQ